MNATALGAMHIPAPAAAAHRDHHVGCLHELICEWFRELLREVDAELGHGFDNSPVDLGR
jgi:hypothetical protein